MGNRITVVLEMDECHKWASDPKLGQMIERMSARAGGDLPESYGHAMSCVHNDTIELTMIGDWDPKRVLTVHWSDADYLREFCETLDERFLKFKHKKIREALRTKKESSIWDGKWINEFLEVRK